MARIIESARTQLERFAGARQLRDRFRKQRPVSGQGSTNASQATEDCAHCAKVKARLDRQARRTIRSLALFSPNSRMDRPTRVSLALQSAQQTFPNLERLLSTTGMTPPTMITTQQFSSMVGVPETNRAGELAELFVRYGSDKATDHDYEKIYAPILENLGTISSMLEVGLGTTNADVPSSMPETYTPGGSLRAFRDFLPDARIIGADIDERILFSEHRIETHHVDQTDPASAQRLAEKIDTPLDLVIDDGLHSPNANLSILNLAATKLRTGGWVVIEDIGRAAAPFWRTVAMMLEPAFETYVIEAKGALVFAATRR